MFACSDMDGWHVHVHACELVCTFLFFLVDGSMAWHGIRQYEETCHKRCLLLLFCGAPPSRLGSSKMRLTLETKYGLVWS